MDTFSLLDRPWVPVLSCAGERQLVSLRASLLEAPQYRRIDAGHPLQTAALYRLHLAVLHRALRGPQDAAQAAGWLQGTFPTGQLTAYLDQHADRFHLFGPQPFLQVVDLDPAVAGENFRSHWARLSAEDGSANTTALFNREIRPGGDRRDTLTPAEAALRLLEHQTFALGGLIKRFTTSAKAAPVATLALFLAEGDSLHQTLCLNLVPYSWSEADTPPWEQPPLTVQDIQAIYAPERELARVPAGVVSRYTWQSRSIRLLAEDTPGGPVVRTLGFGAGEPYAGPGEGSGRGLDPMVALRTGEQAFPYKLRRDRLLWRDFTALFPDPAATLVLPKKGQVKLLPGQAPETLTHAGHVLGRLSPRQVAATPRPTLELDNDNAPLASPEESHAPTRGARPAVPVMVFGQLTDQGKAYAMRQESYTLPERFVDDPVGFREEVHTALGDAGLVGEGLRQAVRGLAHALLQRDGNRESHRDDVGKLAAQMPAEATYWAALEVPFRTHLLTPNREAWRAEVRWAALRAWQTAEEAAGLDAKGLRAVQVAGGRLFQTLHALKPDPKEPTP